MIHSVYTHKEIFLREIISNASDAVDKLCYNALTDDKIGMSRSDFFIKITVDKDKRILTITDNGIGMTNEDLESNLGVIARSGSMDFKNDLDGKKDEKKDIEIIGQFGVGFYSAFMVSDEVSVVSRAYGADKAYLWKSNGADGYTIKEAERETVGTSIILKIKEDTEDEKYSEFLETYRLRELIKKYSDYIRYPIKMDIEKSRSVETDEVDDEGNKKTQQETYIEEETVNSMVPIWQRTKKEVSDEDCIAFYKEKYYDQEDPVKVIRINAEGEVMYKAMLFIPAKAPFDFYSREFKKGLQLYSNGVMIMERCEDLLPDHFRFVTGIVDSADLSLNLSRELLQHDRQLKIIANYLEKRIRDELGKLLEADREKYEKFYAAFGRQLKYGILADYGMHKDLLENLLLFHSSNEGKLITLKEYTDKMPEDQKNIYYACGESITKINALPQAEQVKEKGFDMLCFTDEEDEFVTNLLREFDGKSFLSVNEADLGLETEEEKKEIEQQSEDNKDLLDFVKEALKGEVTEVKISHKLKTHAVCLASTGGVSLEMEKYFDMMPGEDKPKAERVLELNAAHSSFAALKNAFDSDKEKATKYAEVLYAQALLIAGLPVEDPAYYTELVSSLLV
ncbi:MAG TPA: molecular chaperone HtpG [Clostridia bacterium]|nr:molecular chaperone HtpG [Clostridia bacterium]